MNPADFLIAAVVGFAVGMAFGWRTWVAIAVDLYRHGRENRLCNRVGCCK